MINFTSVGSCIHSPSTRNLYSCSPSGKSTIVTKSPWLRKETELYWLKKQTKGCYVYLFTIGIVFQLENVPVMCTFLPPPSHLNTVGKTLGRASSADELQSSLLSNKIGLNSIVPGVLDRSNPCKLRMIQIVRIYCKQFLITRTLEFKKSSSSPDAW